MMSDPNHGCPLCAATDACPGEHCLVEESECQEKTVAAVVEYLRHIASGYALMRSIKANGARDAVYGLAEKLEKDWKTIVLPRTTHPKPGGAG